MRPYLPAFATILLVATPASALKPPREESPANREILAAVGAGNSDAALEQAIAAAAAHPLGSLQNPIRVAGPEGERSYLARLRCADGASPDIGAKRPAGVSGYGSVANLYPLDCRAAGPGKLDLVMDQYHAEHVETRAPAGFTFETR